MNRLIRCELIKEFKKVSFKLLLVLIIISSFLTCYISYEKVDDDYETYPKVEVNEISKKQYKLIKKYNIYASNINKINGLSNIKLNKIMDNGITLLIFSSIIMIVISSSVLGNEINKKSIKEILTKPYKRSEILISKFISTYIIIFLLTIFIFISYILFTYILTKTNIFILKDYIIYNNHIKNVSFVLKYLIKFIINSIPIYFLSTLTIFLTTLIKNQKVIIPINSILFIMSPVIFNFFLNIKFKYIIYTFIPYLDFSIFKNPYSILMLNIEYNINFNMLYGVVILIIYSIMFLLSSLFIFNEKDYY